MNNTINTTALTSDINNFIYASGISLIILVLVIILIWSSIWKGIALWKAAKNGSKFWFILLFIINTLGILEILYIYVFSKKTKLKNKNNATALNHN